jgi:membrane complex biogenesis BtpA family protein
MQSSRQPDWPARKNIVGMVHLLPLPGAPRYGGSMQQVLDRAARDARALADGGVDGIIVENYGDAPFFPDVVPPVTVAALTRAIEEVQRAVRLAIGVNVLRNDAASALSVAVVTGAQFIRVNVHTGALLTDQGWIAGRAFETLRLRETLGTPVAIYADVLVKHAVPPAGLTIEDAARDAFLRGGADALIVSGTATGAPADIEDVRRVRHALPDAPIWIGSGVTVASVAALLEVADGVIVGSAFQRDSRAGAEVVTDQVRRLVDVARPKHS